MSAPYNYRQPSSRLGAVQSIAYTGSSTPIGAAFGPSTYQIRLSTTTNCNYQVGDGVQTATVNSPYLPSTCVEYVTVTPGQRISAITATGSTNGTLTVTEVT
jgi:hypothetical protein